MKIEMALNLNESQKTEFKQIWKDEYLKTICAFGNTDGGKLYIDVENTILLLETLSIHETVKHQMTLTVGTPSEPDKLILDYILEYGAIKREEVEKLLNIKESRAREILRKMVDDGKILKVGTGKNTCYQVGLKMSAYPL